MQISFQIEEFIYMMKCLKPVSCFSDVGYQNKFIFKDKIGEVNE